VVSAVHEYKKDGVATASYSLVTTDKKASVSLDVHYIIGEKSISSYVDQIRDFLGDSYQNIVTEEKTIA
jgi:hypothetical protein